MVKLRFISCAKFNIFLSKNCLPSDSYIYVRFPAVFVYYVSLVPDVTSAFYANYHASSAGRNGGGCYSKKTKKNCSIKCVLYGNGLHNLRKSVTLKQELASKLKFERNRSQQESGPEG